ncbi:MAG: DUF5131 family protein [Syntrophomonas sp.]|uniref:DUF5131 family protein n=1 Tax=Syntrophomonas sp. TaxID=2053627 RepID=UPI0026060438|nr:DUF5131 family protein [Syntrophomonas sp.]MDD2509979.1 DUF5131 family protein [Syntrophomonas sp.]MDD3878654.1 DUF5131 family protein [Syntrophomonas sp.]MDD4626144.1 DUF5131 family protein [Syntrophomonas sp.]
MLLTQRYSKQIAGVISCYDRAGYPSGVRSHGIHWAIVGGESGPKSREIKTDWVLSIKDSCDYQGLAFYFKQWGGVNKKKNGRKLLGRTWDDMPKVV